MSRKTALILACFVFSALPFVSGCSQGGDSAALAASQAPPSAPVTVVNTPDNPVPVTITSTPTATLEPFRACVVADSQDTLVTVPSGKIAVVESVNAYIQRNPTLIDFPVVALRGVAPDSFAADFSSVAQGTSVGFSIYVVTHVTKLYALSGAQVKASVDTGAVAGGNICISGHFETAAP
jgi:hypothetical protein